ELTLCTLEGNLLRSAVVDLATAADNDWLAFTFPPIRHATGHPFLARFTLAHPGPDTRLSLYDLIPPPARPPGRLPRRLQPPPVRDSLYCRLRYASRSPR